MAGLVVVVAFLLAAAPAKPPVITITKADGTTVRGQLGTIDPKAVSITQLVKNQPTGETLTLPWADIKSLSNGQTQKKVIEQWKRDHPEDKCAPCAGEGKTDCPDCHGTGRDHASAADCESCKGEQIVACAAPKCTDGKVPCPKPCLKPNEGTWVAKPDGKKWRKVPGGEVSDGHLGEIIDTKGGRRIYPCPTCNKTLVVPCPKCGGDSKSPCPTCTTAAAKNDCATCDKGLVPCKTCNATGLASLATEPAPPAPSVGEK